MDAGALGCIACEHMLSMEITGKEFYLQKVFISYMTPTWLKLVVRFSFPPSFHQEKRSSGSEEISYTQ